MVNTYQRYSNWPEPNEWPPRRIAKWISALALTAALAGLSSGSLERSKKPTPPAQNTPAKPSKLSQ